MTGIPENIPIKGPIKSKVGTIRGKKNAVRAKLEILTGKELVRDKPVQKQLYDDELEGRKLVVYTTTNAVIRTTFDRCTSILKLFENMRLKVYRKDVYLDPKLINEMQLRAPGHEVPVVFVNGALLGNAEQVLELNEIGKLKEILAGFEVAPEKNCSRCGGAGYITCTWCQGSLKSLKNPYSGKDVNMNVLKCTLCNSNGLQRCTQC
eukprot:m.134992 g.134992  ORF g.134992 m.134992 type:complete len:207 (+) comp14707_c0_seq7:290-910(+)